MSLTYLPRFTHFLFWMTLLLSWGLNLDLIFNIAVCAYALVFVLFRKPRRNILDGPTFSKDVLYAPINGRVVSVRKGVKHSVFGEDMIEVRMASSWFSEMGVYLPFSSEVKELKVSKGTSFYRYREADFYQETNAVDSLCLSLENSKSDNIGLQLVKCLGGAWPEIAVMPGDRGKRHALIGYFPFGGTAICYIPSNYEGLVSAGDKVEACETIIAGLPKR